MSTGLVGPKGQPISSADYVNKKASPPPLGEQFGTWGGPNVELMRLPGGGAIGFDLDKLGLADFRQMRDHYQINSSLSILMFLMHQIEWRIVCEDKKQQDFYQEEMENIWTPLVRSKSKAFWAGFSPNVLQWDNNVDKRRVNLTKVKDLQPEDSSVSWKTVDGNGTHKINLYDGIKQGMGKKIPVDNTYWYPLLSEEGNYRGRHLLRPAFQPWFFSILLHLFANRYYERFGEPTPIGRAPFDDEIRIGGKEVKGNQAMEIILASLRNRSTVVLPNDKTPVGDETSIDYDYQIEYLESQMRGADFERYINRLDEEISLALFTPILMMRTADVGSYNLGTQQVTTYQWMLNAIAGDWKYYIDWYILRPMRNFNFGDKAPLPKIIFRRMGAQNEELVRDIVRAMIAKESIAPDLDQLGEIAGLSLSKVRELTTPDETGDGGGEEQPGDPTQPSQAADPSASAARRARADLAGVYGCAGTMRERVDGQIRKAFKRGSVNASAVNYGFESQFEAQLRRAGFTSAASITQDFYRRVAMVLEDLVATHDNADAVMDSFHVAVDSLVDAIFE